MHPIIEQDLMRVRTAQLYRQAERERLARAASRIARTQREDRQRNTVPGRIAVLARRMLTSLGALRPSPTR